MTKTLSIFFTILLVFPAGIVSAQKIEIKTTGSGSIHNNTTSVSTGGDAYTSVQVENTLGSDGLLDVQVETNVNGTVEKRRIQEEVRGGSSVEVNTEVSGNNAETAVAVESGTTTTYSIFETWRGLFAEREKATSTESDIEVEALATSTSESGIFVRVYRQILQLFTSIW